MNESQPSPKPRTEFWPGQNEGAPPPASCMAPGEVPYTREEWAIARALIHNTTTETGRKA